jgi:processive 1,2-diacylglycerol beta-glucosyltransferase
MIKLYDNENEKEIGQITEPQLEFLLEELADESLDEYTYNVNPSVISYLEGNGADSQLISLLRGALGSRTSMELRYEPD